MTLLSLPPERPRQDVEVDALDPCRIFAGNASRKLAKAICEKLDVPLGDAAVSRFEDGEVSVRFNENIRGSDVFVVQATGAPADNLMELHYDPVRRTLGIEFGYRLGPVNKVVVIDTEAGFEQLYEMLRISNNIRHTLGD